MGNCPKSPFFFSFFLFLFPSRQSGFHSRFSFPSSLYLGKHRGEEKRVDHLHQQSLLDFGLSFDTSPGSLWLRCIIGVLNKSWSN
ncbi:hypothetical protein U1Q18_043635 [Sarracenia purpurea var. burkii]